MLVKLCGIRSAVVLQQVQECGADIAGFIFADSRRRVSIEEASKIVKVAAGIKTAGVFVNAPYEEIATAVRYCGLDYVQLHGNENSDYAAEIKRRLPVQIIKAFRYNDAFRAQIANDYSADIIIVDSGTVSAYGGTGQVFDWHRAAGELKKINKPLLIAGGISEANVSQVLELLPQAGVDVSSGVEENGEKSKQKIASFMKYVRAYERRNLKC